MGRHPKDSQRHAGAEAAPGPVSAIRLSQHLTQAVDRWAAEHGASSRAAAIRRLVEIGLGQPQPGSGAESPPGAAAAKASELAARQIDRLGDPAASEEERRQRKRRLTKGPSEFRDIRTDQPKPKR